MIRFLLKGLIRDRSRSIYPVAIVAAGSFLVVFLLGFMNGFRDDLVRSNASFDTGHVKIMTRSYQQHADQIPNDLALLDVSALLLHLRQTHETMLWTPRIRFGGLLDIPDESDETRAQGPIVGLGVDLFSPGSVEKDILNLEEALVRGRLPHNTNEILVSDEFAQKTDLAIGEQVTYLGSTMMGAMAIHNFTVSGLVRFGITALDKGAIIADISDVRHALDMADGASEILGFSKNMHYDRNTMAAVQQSFHVSLTNGEDEFAPVMVCLHEQNDLESYLNMAEFFSTIIVSIFVFVMSIVLWNSGLMNGIRRYGEIGIRLAMGEQKGLIYRRMIFESMITALTGALIGTVLGVCITYYIQTTGLDFSEMMEKSSIFVSSVIRTRVTAESYYIGFIPSLLAAIMGTMFAGIGIYKRQTSQLFKELEV